MSTVNEAKSETGGQQLAVVRVRGCVHVKQDIADTLKLLHLTKVNHSVVVDDRPQYKGMLLKVRDYITWGTVNEEMLQRLLTKRGRLNGGVKLSDEYLKKNTSHSSISELSKAVMESKEKFNNVPGLKPVFRLSPPSKGYERKGIKKSYSVGGALGYRGEYINELLAKMI